MLNQIAQIVITYHNERVGKPLIDETCHCKGVNESNKIMVFLPGLAQIYQSRDPSKSSRFRMDRDADSAAFPWTEFT